MTLRVELLSPRGEAALTVVGISGPDVARSLARLVSGSLPLPGLPALRGLLLPRGGGEAAILLRRQPETFELHLHGSPILPGLVAAALGSELTLPVAADLETEIRLAAATAPSFFGLATCLAQLGPAGLSGLARDLALAACLEPITRLERALDQGQRARSLLVPPRVVLRGRTNAGKSTLFNLLVGRPRARVGPEPALTRDPIEEPVVLEGHAVVLVDTAGEGGEHHGPVDEAAVAAARRAGTAADLLLWLHAAGDPQPPPPRSPGWLRLGTHADRSLAERPPLDLPYFDLTAEGPQLRRTLGKHVLDALHLPPPVTEPAWVTARQRTELCTILAARRGRDAAAAAAATHRLLAGSPPADD